MDAGVEEAFAVGVRRQNLETSTDGRERRRKNHDSLVHDVYLGVLTRWSTYYAISILMIDPLVNPAEQKHLGLDNRAIAQLFVVNPEHLQSQFGICLG